MLVIAVVYGDHSAPFTFTCVSEENIDWHALEDVLLFLDREHTIQACNTNEILVFDNEQLVSHWTYEDELGPSEEEQIAVDSD